MSHVRIKIKRSGRRITDRHGSSETICGDDPTAQDITMADAKLDLRDGFKWLGCHKCQAAVRRMVDKG